MPISLFSFGDSWMAGHRGDFYQHFKQLGITPTHNEKDYTKHEQWLKENTSIPALISKHYNFVNKNYATGGCSNYPQLDKLTNLLLTNQITKNDIVFFGFTTFFRDRARFEKIYTGLVTDISKGEFMADRELYNTNLPQLALQDNINHLIILQKLQLHYGFNLIVYNLWTNHFSEKLSVLEEMGFNFLVGHKFARNTWYDIIKDTYNTSGPQVFEFSTLENVDPLYRDLFSWDAHPSQKGYEKIFNHLISEKIFENLL